MFQGHCNQAVCRRNEVTSSSLPLTGHVTKSQGPPDPRNERFMALSCRDEGPSPSKARGLRPVILGKGLGFLAKYCSHIQHIVLAYKKVM